jgi:hypothetical protein
MYRWSLALTYGRLLLSVEKAFPEPFAIAFADCLASGLERDNHFAPGFVLKPLRFIGAPLPKVTVPLSWRVPCDC